MIKPLIKRTESTVKYVQINEALQDGYINAKHSRFQIMSFEGETKYVLTSRDRR